MKRTALFACFVIVFTAATSVGCAYFRKPPAAKPLEANAPFTLRPLGIDPAEFVRAADALIEHRAPKYRYHDAQVHLGFGLLKKYGITNKDANGDIYIVLGRPALMLATVEDLAAVLLHEYIHVVYWDHVFDNSFGGATEECKKVRAEMIANKITIELYHTIGYRRDMLIHATQLYHQARVYSEVIKCPLEITIDMPKYPVPKNLRGPQPVAPLRGDAPDYMDGGRPEDYLNPWEDPNKTDPLYPHQRKPRGTPSNPVTPSDVE